MRRQQRQRRQAAGEDDKPDAAQQSRRITFRQPAGDGRGDSATAIGQGVIRRPIWTAE